MTGSCNPCRVEPSQLPALVTDLSCSVVLHCKNRNNLPSHKMCLHAGNESAGSDLQPEFIYHHRLLTILNNIRTKCETGCAEDLMGRMKGWTQTQLPVSPLLCTLKV